MVVTRRQEVSTSGQGDVHDLTKMVGQIVGRSGCRSGLATVSVVGSTAALTTIECEPGAVADFNGLLETLAPRHGPYAHHERWGDDNGSSHVRAALVGPSLSVPFDEGQLLLGTWQQIILIECDTRPRQRPLVVQVMGE
tara:strand:+ start:231 stop:647 length:417 start_codon:yes stop_codon:yes gene_type:complete